MLTTLGSQHRLHLLTMPKQRLDTWQWCEVFSGQEVVGESQGTYPLLGIKGIGQDWTLASAEHGGRMPTTLRLSGHFSS